MERQTNVTTILTPARYNLRNFTDVFQQLKDRVSILDVVHLLDLENRFKMQQVGTSLQGRCPIGHASKSQQSFSIDLDKNLYHCFSCEEAGDIVQLVELTERVGRLEAVRFLIDKLAPSLKQSIDEWIQNLSPEEKQKYDRAFLYRLVYDEGKRLLYQSEGSLALDYLTHVRGYDSAKLQTTEWIYWDTTSNIRRFLASKAPDRKEQIDQLPLNGAYGDPFRLALPFRDRNGVITGFLKRAHEKQGFDIKDKKGVRWDSTAGLTKPDLYGLNRIKNQRELIIVEGYPDAAYLPSLGLDNIVALGTATFSEKYIEGLHAKQIKRIILGLDNDGGTGIKNSEQICRILGGSDINVFVIDPPMMGICKDPDEYVLANGIDAFRALVSNAEAASAWMTRRILIANAIGTDIGKAKAIDEALEYAETIHNPLEAQNVIDAIRTQLNLTAEMLDRYYHQFKEKAARSKAEMALQNATRSAQRMIKEGDLEPAIRNLRSEADRMLITFGRVGVEPEKPFTDFLAAKQTSDAQRTGQRLGYELKQFPTIDNAMCGLQPSMIAIGADPNTGKTILTVNLAVDILESNPQTSVLFYSMDDTRDAIVSRFVAKLSGQPINDVQRQPKDVATGNLIERAYRWLSSMALANRLDVKEMVEGLTMGSIREGVRNHPMRDSLIVIIDGMYNIPMDDRYSSIREENIDRANCVKELVKLYKVPAIVTAELRKRSVEDSKKKERTLHDIMETGKYAYNADVVCLLTPDDPDKYRTEAEPIMRLEIEKNKLSSFRGTIPLTFTKNEAKFAEASISYTQGIRI